MALTGLFLCLFLVGHLLGNLQLLIPGAEGKRVFNEYAYFMTHNPLIRVLSYVTYFSILFHAIDGLILTIQNSKARKKNYAYNKPSANSSFSSRNMGILGTIILIFIVTHMVNFWAVMHFGDKLPLHTELIAGKDGQEEEKFYLVSHGQPMPVRAVENGTIEIRNKNEFFLADSDVKVGDGVLDLHSLVMSFFGQDKTKEGIPAHPYAAWATILYVLAMIALSFHLWHGFASAFQSLGLRTHKYKKFIHGFGTVFSIVIPLAFAVIPVYIYLTK